MIALIDADILVYRVGFTTQDADERLARWRLEESIQVIVDALETAQFNCYLTSQDKSNFRYSLSPDYKAHRVQPKPLHYLFLRNVLINDYGAIVVENQEADDQLGIDQTKLGDKSIICSIDKDLDQIAGWHYNFVKLHKYKIGQLEGTRQFYTQCLVGDKGTDNIEGCPGIGAKKATRLLEGCENELEMVKAVSLKYHKAYGEEWTDRLLLAGNLLWIRRYENQSWELSPGSRRGEVVSKGMLENFLKDSE